MESVSQMQVALTHLERWAAQNKMELNSKKTKDMWITFQKSCPIPALIKDGAYYCYCAYVLRMSRYSDILSPVLTHAGIFLRSLKLSGESRSK